MLVDCGTLIDHNLIVTTKLMRTFLSLLTTGTMGAAHSENCTGWMIPCFFSLSNSSSTRARKAKGTDLTCSVAFSLHTHEMPYTYEHVGINRHLRAFSVCLIEDKHLIYVRTYVRECTVPTYIIGFNSHTTHTSTITLRAKTCATYLYALNRVVM